MTNSPIGRNKIELVETFTLSGDFAQERFAHDARGNLTYDGRYAFTYDAWNRLVKVQRAWRDSSTGDLHTGSTIAMMGFDGSGRRIKKAVDNSGDWDCTYHYYLDGQRIVETRDGSNLVLTQQVWGLTYIDELVQTGVNQDVGCSVLFPDGPEDAPEICERFFWILQDANYNVLGSAAATGLLLERYEYDPYGRRTVFGHNWLLADVNDDGAVNVSEMALLGTFGSTNDPADRRDLNGDGAINICDWSMMVGDYPNASGIPNDALCTHPRGESGRGSHAGSYTYNRLPAGICDFGHQGLLLDKEFEKYDNRARENDYITMRMMQWDPFEYPDGMNGFESRGSMPTNGSDPFGTAVIFHGMPVQASGPVSVQTSKQYCDGLVDANERTLSISENLLGQMNVLFPVYDARCQRCRPQDALAQAQARLRDIDHQLPELREHAAQYSQLAWNAEIRMGDQYKKAQTGAFTLGVGATGEHGFVHIAKGAVKVGARAVGAALTVYEAGKIAYHCTQAANADALQSAAKRTVRDDIAAWASLNALRPGVAADVARLNDCVDACNSMRDNLDRLMAEETVQADRRQALKLEFGEKKCGRFTQLKRPSGW